MALLSAVATFLGALFICLSPPDGRHTSAITLAPSAQLQPAFSCPYENGSCGVLPAVGPAVLTAPPPDSPPPAGPHPPYAGPPAHAAPAPGTARSRAPDLHVLQVLRT
ncbi:hypothetical protein [Streptomyces jumonjinensis]|nr:hypothetical protein [Streptomyces jumonjinensis]